MKLKKLTAIVLTTFAVTLAGGCTPATPPASSPSPSPSATPSPSGSPVAQDTSWEYITANKKIVVGLDDSFPPMGFRDEATDEIVGVDIDLANAVGEELGLEIELKPIDWKAKEMELSSKKIDVIWNGFTITDERKEALLLSKPYMDNKQVIVVLEGSDVKTKADLVDKKIGVQGGSSAVGSIEADPLFADIKDDNLMQFDTIPMALRDLSAKRVDAIVADEVVVEYYITLAQDSYTILAENFGVEQFGVGFRKEDKEFAAKFEEAFDKVKTSQAAKDISEKWFGNTDAIK